jgi:hypothetical protein
MAKRDRSTKHAHLFPGPGLQRDLPRRIHSLPCLQHTADKNTRNVLTLDPSQYFWATVVPKVTAGTQANAPGNEPIAVRRAAVMTIFIGQPLFRSRLAHRSRR